MPKDVKKDDCCKNDLGVFVSIPASLAGIFLVLTVLFLIFANSQLGLLVPIVWAFVVLGIVAVLVAARVMRR